MTQNQEPVTKADITNLALSMQKRSPRHAGVPWWAIVLVASVSMMCSISAFVVFDNFATPRVLKQGLGKQLLNSLEDIEQQQRHFVDQQKEFIEKEEELLSKEEDLLRRLELLESRLEQLER